MTQGERAVPEIAGYADLTEIGRGGFATVYRAHRDAFAQDVAIKVLDGRDLDREALARFDRERTALGVLAQHPHIITVYDGGVIPGGRPYLVMEYLPRGSLHDELRRAGPAPVPTVLDIGVKLCGALETAHRAGVLHRDVKPANVLISRYGEPLLADFGIARVSGAAVTASGVVTASLAHAPPEVVDGKHPTPAADVWSLASSLFCLLTGSAPFSQDSDESVAPMLARLFRDPVPDLRSRGVPDVVCHVLEQAMTKDPARRTASALALGEQLRDAQHRLGTDVSTMVVEGVRNTVHEQRTVVRHQDTIRQSAPSPRPERTAVGRSRSSRWRPVALVVAAALLGAGAVGAVLLTREARSSPPAALPSTTNAPSVVTDLQEVLLDFSEFAPEGSQLDSPPIWGFPTVLFCPRTADEAGKIDQVSRSISSGGPRPYLVDSYVARFEPGGAEAFLGSVRTTAEQCADNGLVDLPRSDPPPPGGDELVRVTAAEVDAIWVRRGDYVLTTTVRFDSGPTTDSTTAPDLAARASAKLAQALS